MVENFMKGVRFREMFIDELKEALSNICCHVLAVWRVEPQDISLSSIPLSGCLARLERDIIEVATFVECFLIDPLSIIEAFLIR